MNCQQAKKIPITHYLATKGIKPQRLKNGSAWYNSPFRNETTPSFKVDRQNNIWYDFGSGTGGNILDLVMDIEQTNITGVLMILQRPELSKTRFFSFEQQNFSSNIILIRHIQPLQNRALIQYLNSRKISYSKAVNYVKEAYYKVKERQYFAIAFKNDRNGYELRSKIFKGSTSPKAITSIPGQSNNKALNIFEGLMDFLSALQFYDILRPGNTTIVLNSTNNLDIIIDTLSQFEKINLYLDNDSAGKLAVETIKKKCRQVTDFSAIYKEYNDFNDFLISKKTAYQYKLFWLLFLVVVKLIINSKLLKNENKKKFGIV